MPATSVQAGWQSLPEEERGRADTYRLLGLLTGDVPPPELLEALCGQEFDDTKLGRAYAALGKMAGQMGATAIADEYERLFIGVPVARVMPYGSHYRNGQMFGRALAELRMELAHLGIARKEDATEPEDRLATLCEVMAGFIVGAFGSAPLPLAEQSRFFAAHIQPWAGRFFEDLESDDQSAFYMAVARLGRTFFDLEIEAFKMVPR